MAQTVPIFEGVWMEVTKQFIPRVKTNRSTAVLQLYRTILKTGLDWKQVELDRSGSDPEVRKKVLQERQYIKWEAKRLFKRNKNITDLERVEKKIFEATTRLDMANHYMIPYPRRWERMGQGAEHEEPAYMDSYLPFNTGVDETFLDFVQAPDVAFVQSPH
uniref:Uncharacterized protein n=1 Tax=Eutreptiella gymnastica TaxID=73025 RepID=A0A7S4LM52_9EUGL